MNYEIRQMRPSEFPLLEDFLYGAIYVPEAFEGEVPRSVIYDDPLCRAAFEGFGTRRDDRALVAQAPDGRVIGVCWVRTTKEYGHIDDETPSFSISVKKDFRGRGIGGALMRGMLAQLREAGYSRASLSVQKANPALRLYERLGFRIVGDGVDNSEWLMVCSLSQVTGLELRMLTHKDIPLFAQMRIDQLLEEGAQQTTDLRPALTNYYERHLEDGSFVSWLAFDADKVVGTSGLSLVEKPPYFGCPTGRIGLVSSMYTDPLYRRRGIARDLLCRIVGEARLRGCGVIQITASDAGVPLYEGLGFERNANFRQLTL